MVPGETVTVVVVGESTVIVTGLDGLDAAWFGSPGYTADAILP
jgi:hypothetical protein